MHFDDREEARSAFALAEGRAGMSGRDRRPAPRAARLARRPAPCRPRCWPAPGRWRARVSGRRQRQPAGDAGAAVLRAAGRAHRRLPSLRGGGRRGRRRRGGGRATGACPPAARGCRCWRWPTRRDRAGRPGARTCATGSRGTVVGDHRVERQDHHQGADRRRPRRAGLDDGPLGRRVAHGGQPQHGGGSAADGARVERDRAILGAGDGDARAGRDRLPLPRSPARTSAW